MAWAALIPAAMSAVSALSQSSGGGAGGSQQGVPKQGPTGWDLVQPQTGGTLAGGQQQQGDKPFGIMDAINPAGSQNTMMQMLAPDPLSRMIGGPINSLLSGIFK